MDVSLSFGGGPCGGMFVDGGYVVNKSDYPSGQAASLQTGDISDGGQVSVKLPLTFLGAGVLSFWWRVSSEENYDYFTFYIDGVSQTEISGDTAWEQRSYNLASGNHLFEWVYSKDSSVSENLDCGLLGLVTATNVAEPPNRIVAFAEVSELDEYHMYAEVTYEPKFEVDGIPSYIVQDASGYTVDTQNYPVGYGGSMKTRPIADSGLCFFTVSGYFFRSGEISFYRKVSSASGDYFRFYIDGVSKYTISGESDWAQVSYTVTAGFHVLKWQYSKNSSGASGSDAGFISGLYLSNISFEPLQQLLKAVTSKADTYYPVIRLSAAAAAKVTAVVDQFKARSELLIPAVTRETDAHYKSRSELTVQVQTRMSIEPELPEHPQDILSYEWYPVNILCSLDNSETLRPGSYVIRDDGKVLYCFTKDNIVYLSLINSEYEFFTVADCVKAGRYVFDVSAQFANTTARTCKLQRLPNGRFLLYVGQVGVDSNAYPEKIVVYESRDQGQSFAYKSTLRSYSATYANYAGIVNFSVPITLPSGRIGIVANVGGSNGAGLLNSADKTVFYYSDDGSSTWNSSTLLSSALYRWWSNGIAYYAGTLAAFVGYRTLFSDTWQVARIISANQGASWTIADGTSLLAGSTSGVFYGEDGYNYLFLEEINSTSGDLTSTQGLIWDGAKIASWPANTTGLNVTATQKTDRTISIDALWNTIDNNLCAGYTLTYPAYVQCPANRNLSVITVSSGNIVVWAAQKIIRKPRTAMYRINEGQNKKRVRKVFHKINEATREMHPTVRVKLGQYAIGGITL